MAEGYIYVLFNDHIPKLVKLGFTDRHPNDRVRELSSHTGVPGQFELHAHWLVEDAAKLERKLFSVLSSHRETGEFFRLSPDEASEHISALLKKWGEIDANGFSIPARQRAEERERKERTKKEDDRRRETAIAEWSEQHATFNDRANRDAERECGMSFLECQRIIEEYSFSFFGKISKAFGINPQARKDVIALQSKLYAGGNRLYMGSGTNVLKDAIAFQQNLLETSKRLYSNYRADFFKTRGFNYKAIRSGRNFLLSDVKEDEANFKKDLEELKQWEDRIKLRKAGQSLPATIDIDEKSQPIAHASSDAKTPAPHTPVKNHTTSAEALPTAPTTHCIGDTVVMGGIVGTIIGIEEDGQIRVALPGSEGFVRAAPLNTPIIGRGDVQYASPTKSQLRKG